MKNVLFLALSILMIASCATSNEVASNKLFQKRKYTKGWNVNSSQAIDKSNGSTKEELVVNSNNYTETVKEFSDQDKSRIDNLSNFNHESTFSGELIEIDSYEVFVQNENFKSISVETSEIASHLFSHNELNTDKEMVEVSLDSVSSNQLESNNSSDDDMLMLLYLCAILIPFVAVGISTDWDVKKVLINVLLTFLCYIPGVIHAFITIRDYYR
ncbi:MAG: YqaE/Pmp3 family membrane protein [Flavobacteriales bacterium]